MNPLYIKYAEKMSDLSERMINLINQFPLMEESSTIEELKAKYDTYMKGINEFNNFKSNFISKTKPGTYPVIIKNEHQQIIEELGKFTGAIESISDSLDISQCYMGKDNMIYGVEFDSAAFEEASEVQQEAIENVVQLVEEICMKLGI